MDIFTKFKETLKLFGLEYYSKYYSFYRGSVYDNRDPEYLGRLRIYCPQVYEEGVSPNYWAYPRGMPNGSFIIPRINDPIYVTFENGDPRFPCWEHGWYYTDTAPANAKRDIPNNFMYQTPEGQRIEFDDENKKITLTNNAGFIVDLTQDGIKIHKGGDSLKKSLDDLYDEIKKIQVPTPMGMSGFPVNSTVFDTLSQAVANFLV